MARTQKELFQSEPDDELRAATLALALVATTATSPRRRQQLARPGVPRRLPQGR